MLQSQTHLCPPCVKLLFLTRPPPCVCCETLVEVNAFLLVQKAPHWKPSAHSTRSLSQRSVTVPSCWPVLRYFTKRVIRVATINQEGIEWPLGSPCLQAFRSWLLNHSDHTAFCGAWNPHCKNAEAKSRQIDITLAPPPRLTLYLFCRFRPKND